MPTGSDAKSGAGLPAKTKVHFKLNETREELPAVKILAASLITVIPAGLIGVIVWVILALHLTGWVLWSVALVGLVLGTLVSLGLWWVLWPRPVPDDLRDDDDPDSQN